MKKLLIAIMAFAAVAASAIEIREVTFSPEEIPATNPRIERKGETATHIEVFGAFETRPDGTVKTRVAESAVDMDAVAAQLWVREAKAALGAATPTIYSKWKAFLVLSEMGVWPQVKAWLEANNLWDAFLIANEFADNEPHFIQDKAALQAQLGLTDDEVSAILARCIAD